MILRTALTLTLSGLAVAAVAQDVPAPIEPEVFFVEEGIAEGPYIFGVSGSWTGASNVYTLGHDLELKGNVSPGMQPAATVTADASKIYAMSNYNARIMWGETTSVVQEFDVQTQSLLREFEVPAKLAMVDSQPALIQLSSDEKFVLVQNATPATSVSIVDLEKGEFLVEIPTPGCWGILPTVTDNAFTTICGDGTFATYSWAADGTFGEPVKSEQIFDVDADALFTNPAELNGKLVFASFKGNLYVVDITGEAAVLEEVLPMAEGVEGDWAPSGSEVIAGHHGTSTVYVLMHSGAYEGSHKNESEEIWAYDLTNKTLGYRSFSDAEDTLMMVQGDVPMLYAAGNGEINFYEVDPTARSAARIANTWKSGGIGMMVAPN